MTTKLISNEEYEEVLKIHKNRIAKIANYYKYKFPYIDPDDIYQTGLVALWYAASYAKDHNHSVITCLYNKYWWLMEQLVSGETKQISIKMEYIPNEIFYNKDYDSSTLLEDLLAKLPSEDRHIITELFLNQKTLAGVAAQQNKCISYVESAKVRILDRLAQYECTL